MAATESYVDKGGSIGTVFKRQLIYVTGGEVFITDLDGNPTKATVVSNVTNNAFNKEYAPHTTDGLIPRNTHGQIVEALPDRASSSNEVVFPEDAEVEIVCFKHVGHSDETTDGVDQPSVTMQFNSQPQNNSTITIVDRDDVSKTYTAKTSGANASNQEYDIGNNVSDAMTNFEALVESANGHNGSLLLQNLGAGNTFRIRQKRAGIAGNGKSISSTSDANVTINGSGDSGTFSGGTDTAPHNYAYMTDGTRYVKVDISTTTPKISQWIGPYGTVVSRFQQTDFYAPLIQQLGARLVLAGIGPAANNWFLSAINDPYDWRPSSGETTLVDSIAGDSGTQFGQVGDNIKALIPVGSNSIVFAGSNSMTMLTGDPAFSDVKFRQISRSIGVLGKRAFTPVNEMATLICSSEGVFAIDPNTFDIERGSRISADRLDALFALIDFENTAVCMGYDDSRGTALLCLTRTDDPATSRVYALAVRAGSWWPWEIGNPDMRGIRTVTPFRPVEGTRTVPFFGTDTGFLLSQPETTVLHEDGGVLTSTAFASVHVPQTGQNVDFSSELLIGPINSDPSRRVLLRDVRVILGAKREEQDDTVETGPFLQILSAQTGQEAVGFATDVKFLSQPTVLDGGSGNSPTQSTTFTGGAANTANNGYDAILWAGMASDYAGSYTPTSTSELLIDTTFIGPGGWKFKRNTNGRWELLHPDVLTPATEIPYYRTTNVISGLPQQVELNVLGDIATRTKYTPASDVARSTTAGFANSNVTAAVLLSRGRSTAKRVRIRDSDIYLNIGANSRAWTLEDLSVDIEDGGPFRSMT